MTEEQFKILIETLEKTKGRCSAAYDLGIDLISYDEDYQKVITLLIGCIFGEEGKDWIEWYLYERPSFNGKLNLATDENGNEICHNIESLWDTVKPHIKYGKNKV